MSDQARDESNKPSRGVVIRRHGSNGSAAPRTARQRPDPRYEEIQRTFSWFFHPEYCPTPEDEVH